VLKIKTECKSNLIGKINSNNTEHNRSETLENLHRIVNYNTNNRLNLLLIEWYFSLIDGYNRSTDIISYHKEALHVTILGIIYDHDNIRHVFIRVLSFEYFIFDESVERVVASKKHTSLTLRNFYIAWFAYVVLELLVKLISLVVVSSMVCKIAGCTVV
jgi:hypothetical protein